MNIFFKSNRSFLILLLLLLSASPKAGAQKRQVCGFDHFYKRQLRDPQAAMKIQSANLKIGNVQRSLDAIRQTRRNRDVMPGPGGTTLYQIPVVVHIMHRPGDALGSVNNPTDATIQQMIAFLNKVYEGTNISSGGVTTPLRFVLAKRTPDCQATTGINRVTVNNAEYITNGLQDGPTGPGMPEAALKGLSRWPVNEYYNIWIVHKIYNADPDLITNGYAYFPGDAGDLDGTVLRGDVANGTAQTLPHEMGHALALYHTFEGGDDGVNCPANTGDCTADGDRVCDTDPHIINYNCPLATDINSCTSNPWGLLPKNIMGYFACRDRFSPGQGSRMEATMLTERYGLVASLGGTAPTGTIVTAIDHKTTVSKKNNNNDMGPVKVVLNSLYYASAGYRSATKIAYEDKTCTMGTSLNNTSAYNITVNTVLNDQTVKVWIDLNNDGTYGTGELIGTSTGTTGDDYTHQLALTIAQLNLPGTVYNKPLRMRVAADFSGNPGYTFNSELQYGQMEDFAVTINNTVLPVNFGAITAATKNGTLQVNWTSEKEVNNDAYLVQVSRDGELFYTLGTVKTQAPDGNSDTSIDYHFSIGTAGISSVFAGLMLLAFGSFAGTGKRKWLLRLSAGLIVLALWGFNNSCNRKEGTALPDQPGTFFVRIGQVDKDGVTRYSKVVKINND